MPTLEIYKDKGGKPIFTFPLDEDIITIGRSGDNDIVLPDSKARTSRYHAALLRDQNDPNSYIVRDLSSTGGTMIGANNISSRLLCYGDEINIVNFRLKYISSDKKSDPDSPFILVDEMSDELISSAEQDSSNLVTVTLFELENIDETVSPAITEEVMEKLDEFLFTAKKKKDASALLYDALDVLFHLLNLKKGSIACFAFFVNDTGIQYMAGKGNKRSANISILREALYMLKAGKRCIKGNHLWTPLSGDANPLGFLYVQNANYFTESEIETASFACRIFSKALKEMGAGNTLNENNIIKWPSDMVGNKYILKEISRVAALDENVLLLGETGVGKEVAADEIHRQSGRSNKVLRKINCSSIPKGLVEGELFGHKKGAFNEAGEKKGEFELADGGTLLLDEIGDLPYESQSKILRVIQDKKIKRLGDEKSRKIDVRVIAATNRDINKCMEEGKFRNDLFYRFGERIWIKPLRERKNDIPLLAHFFLDSFMSERNMRSGSITPQAMKCLLAYKWPGNARELRNCIGKALSVSKGTILAHHLPIKSPDKPVKEEVSVAPESLGDLEKQHIMKKLRETRGNKKRTAEKLEITKQTLYNKMDKYDIPRDYGKKL